MGAALAWVWRPSAWSRPLPRAARWGIDAAGIAAVVTLVVGFVAVSEFDAGLYRQGGFLRVGMLAAVVIVAATRTRGAVGGLLSRPLLVAVGRRSYGLYLYHWPVFVLGRELPLPPWKIDLLCVLVTVAVAEASYRWIETPVRRGGLGALMGRMRLPRPAVVVAFGAASAALLATVVALTGQGTAVGDAPDTALSASSPGAAPPQGGPVLPRNAAPANAQGTAALGAPGASAPPSPPGATSVRPLGPTLVVGDSIALGSADSLRRALGASTTVDAKVGRQFSAAPRIVAAWAAVNDGTVVIDLGANGTVAEDDVNAVLTAAGGRRVVFVGVHVPRRWQDGNNAALRAAAAAHPTVAFVDWDALVDANPGALGPDGVHPGVAGRTLLADAVAAAARKQ